MKFVSEGLGSIRLPAILFVNMNHFVVLEGVEPGWFHLNDPASGRRKVSAAEFDGMFSGVALVFEKTPDFRSGGAPRRVLHGLFERLQKSLPAMGLIVALGLLTVAISLITPAFSRVFIDYVQIEGLTDWLTPLLVAMGVTAAAFMLATWLRAHLVTRLEAKLGLVLGGRLAW